jgi:toxin ParE1/3/4
VASYRLTPRARQELREIWRYTRRTWSERQAERYASLLLDAIERLADAPELGRPADDIRPGYRKHRLGSHLIFYRVTGEAVEVVRILHGRMDIEGQFDSDN